MEDYSSSSSSQPSPHYYSSPAPSRPNHIMSTPPPASPQNPSSAPLACRSQPPHHHHVSGHSRPYAHPGASPHLTFGKPKRNLKWLRWRCVLGASLIHFCLGSVHTLGNLLPYIVGYIRTKQSPPPTATYKVTTSENSRRALFCCLWCSRSFLSRAGSPALSGGALTRHARETDHLESPCTSRASHTEEDPETAL